MIQASFVWIKTCSKLGEEEILVIAPSHAFCVACHDDEYSEDGQFEKNLVHSIGTFNFLQIKLQKRGQGGTDLEDIDWHGVCYHNGDSKRSIIRCLLGNFVNCNSLCLVLEEYVKNASSPHSIDYNFFGTFQKMWKRCGSTFKWRVTHQLCNCEGEQIVWTSLGCF